MNGSAARFCCSLGALLALTAAGAAVAAPKAPAPDAKPSPQLEAALAEARQPTATPSLGSIPPLPKDVRSIAAWKSSVLAVKGEGRELAAAVAGYPWTLEDTEGWAARERAAAEPPPAVTVSSQADTEAYAAAMRARAMPPPRKR